MLKKWAKHLNGPETELQNGKCHEPEVYGVWTLRGDKELIPVIWTIASFV